MLYVFFFGHHKIHAGDCIFMLVYVPTYLEHLCACNVSSDQLSADIACIAYYKYFFGVVTVVIIVVVVTGLSLCIASYDN